MCQYRMSPASLVPTKSAILSANSCLLRVLLKFLFVEDILWHLNKTQEKMARFLWSEKKPLFTYFSNVWSNNDKHETYLPPIYLVLCSDFWQLMSFWHVKVHEILYLCINTHLKASVCSGSLSLASLSLAEYSYGDRLKVVMKSKFDLWNPLLALNGDDAEWSHASFPACLCSFCLLL